MKHIHYLYIGAFTFLIACSSEERITTDSNEEPSGPIELSAGIAEGNSKATTRTGAEDHHTTPGHQTFTSDTKIALRVSGTWTGHGESPYTVVKTTTATVGAETSSGSKHNSLTCSPLLYWDDYGSADLANAATGRTEGLTIYGAAVNGQTSIPTDLSSINGVTTASAWEGLSWTLPADQSSGWSTKDLLISNNISGDNGATYQNDYGRYLFDKRTLGKLLEFKHAMSKITVVMTAGDGFVGGVFDATTQEEVKLTSNDATTSNADWPLITGKVNITDGVVDITSSGQGTHSTVIMYEAANSSTVTKEALVMPGSLFGSNDNDIIARINADGNIYYVTAQNIRTAMRTANSSTDYKTEAGKNYIINVTVDKTGISHVSATVADWTNVSADPVAPKVNVTGNLGNLGSSLPDDNYSFYFSKFEDQYSINKGYGTVTEAGNIDFYAEQRYITKSGTDWTMSSDLYWPDHNTHYQFRCVWPRTTTNSGTVTKVAPAVSDSIHSNPRVELFTYGGQDYHIIRVQNVAYTAGTFPSDLMIARPEDIDQNCSNTESGHNTQNLYRDGICATQGTINLNFKYMMSQVEVNLKTNDSQADEVNITNAKVELVDVHKTGLVKLGDRGIFLNGVRSATPAPATDTFGDYPLGNYTLTTPEGKKNANYRSAIVPQSVANARFRITIYKNGVINDGIDDIYYADIAPLTSNSEWTSGNRYVYTLTVTKTKVNATVTLTDWTTNNASQNIWF